MLNDAGSGALNGVALNEIAVNGDDGGVPPKQTLADVAFVAAWPLHIVGGSPFALLNGELPPGDRVRGTPAVPAYWPPPSVMGSPSVIVNVNFYVRGTIVG